MDYRISGPKTEESMSTETENIFEPNTPEYQALYDKAMEDLNNSKPVEKEGEPEDVQTPEPETPEPETPDTPAADDPLAAKMAEMERQIASTGKALKDTQKWGHGLSTKVKELQKQLETATTAQRPALLDQVEGLQDAIDYAVNTKLPKVEDNIDMPVFEDEPEKNITWVDTVSAALPDLGAMLNDPDMKAKADALRQSHASEWDNPVAAIRYLSQLRTEHLTQKAVREAIAATSAKHIEAQQRKDGMRIPSGGARSASRGSIDLINDADAVRNMTTEQFQKLRSKTLGY
jgi:hypothetical protein